MAAPLTTTRAEGIARQLRTDGWDANVKDVWTVYDKKEEELQDMDEALVARCQELIEIDQEETQGNVQGPNTGKSNVEEMVGAPTDPEAQSRGGRASGGQTTEDG